MQDRRQEEPVLLDYLVRQDRWSWNQRLIQGDTFRITCEWDVKSGTQGTAVVRFKLDSGYPVFLDSRILTGTLGDEEDRKTYVKDPGCGTYLREHVHSSYWPGQWLIGMNWWMSHPPEINVNGSWTARPPANQADGSWRLVNFFNAMSAFSHPNETSYTITAETNRCNADCVTGHPPGCVAWGPSYIRTDTKRTIEQRAPNPVGWTWTQIGPDKFDVTSSNPAKFSISVEGDVGPLYGCGSEGGKVHVKWDVTVDRVTPP